MKKKKKLHSKFIYTTSIFTVGIGKQELIKTNKTVSNVYEFLISH